MNSPTPDDVLQDLGDKFVSDYMDALDDAKQDLSDFREWRAGWFPHFTSRFTANFIHERLWANLISRVDDHEQVTTVDREPHRELQIGKYRIRLKRHHLDERISTFPTRGAAKFWSSEGVLPGMESVSLALGYMWDAELREIGDPILSYREEIRKPVWGVALERGDGGTAAITWRGVDPSLPDIDLSQVVAAADDTESSSQ